MLKSCISVKWPQRPRFAKPNRVPGVPWHTHISADQLTLFQPGGTDYAHVITTGTPGFSDLPTALVSSTAN